MLAIDATTRLGYRDGLGQIAAGTADEVRIARTRQSNRLGESLYVDCYGRWRRIVAMRDHSGARSVAHGVLVFAVLSRLVRGHSVEVEVAR
jgi:hypothetical protein